MCVCNWTDMQRPFSMHNDYTVSYQTLAPLQVDSIYIFSIPYTAAIAVTRWETVIRLKDNTDAGVMSHVRTDCRSAGRLVTMFSMCDRKVTVMSSDNSRWLDCRNAYPQHGPHALHFTTCRHTIKSKYNNNKKKKKNNKNNKNKNKRKRKTKKKKKKKKTKKKTKKKKTKTKKTKTTKKRKKTKRKKKEDFA